MQLLGESAPELGIQATDPLKQSLYFGQINLIGKQLAREIAMQISAMEPKDTEVLLKQDYIRDNSITIEQLVKSAIGKIGENITIGRFKRFALGE